MGIRALVLAVLWLAPTVAAAQEPPRPSVNERSPGVALGLSLGVTATGVGLMFTESAGGIGAGVILFAIGPTTGHWYAGRAGNGGTVARLVGVGVMTLGLTQVDIGLSGDDDDDEDGLAIMLGGAIIYSAGAVYEIYTAPRAVHEYNARIAIAPLVSPQSAGLALAGSF